MAARSASVSVQNFPLMFLVSFSTIVAVRVVIGPSPSLAYCTIFIVMSSDVVDLHNCIFIRTSHCLYLCTHRLRAAATLS